MKAKPETKRQSLIKGLVERFVSTRYPEEAPYFSLIWREYLTHDGELPSDHGKPEYRTTFKRLGLPFADDRALTLASPYVLLTLGAVFREMQLRQASPDLGNVQQAVRDAATALGATPELASEMVEDLSPQLLTTFESGDFQIEPLPGSAEDDAAHVARGECYVLWFQPGEAGLQKKGWMPCDEADQFAQLLEPDIIINEPEKRIAFNMQSGPRPPKFRSTGNTGILYLVLTNIHRSFNRDDIDEIRRNPKVKPTTNSAIQHYPSKFRAWLKKQGLSKELISEKAEGDVYVVVNDFSVVWIRQCHSHNRSRLIYASSARAKT